MPNFHQWIERLALSTLVHVLFAQRIGSGNGVENDIEWNLSVDSVNQQVNHITTSTDPANEIRQFIDGHRATELPATTTRNTIFR
jgi:hypothetical protein